MASFALTTFLFIFFSFFLICPVIRPDINALRDRQVMVAPNTSQLTTLTFQPPALEDLEAPRRQTSLDGEAIRIIIHDVDSGPLFAAKRRVTLRRDPTDKAHRSISIFPYFMFLLLFSFLLTHGPHIQLCCVKTHIFQTCTLKMNSPPSPAYTYTFMGIVCGFFFQFFHLQ